MAEPLIVRTTTAPTLGATIELLKPITWFAPMWAFGCGVVSSGVTVGDRWPYVVVGILLAGPLVCGTSQAVNDWYDREVDAINEPKRVIPSGRMPGRWGFGVAVVNTIVSLAVAWWLGAWVFGAAVVGLALAWAYSAPPLRLKQNGWLGNAAVGFCYEGVPWDPASNRTGWTALIGDDRGGPDVSPYAAASRATDLAGLSPAYLDTGSSEIFRDEILDYGARLARAGVPTELHSWAGGFHGFDMVPHAEVSRAARDARTSYLRRAVGHNLRG